MIKFTGPEDRIVRLPDRVTEKVTEKVSDRQRKILTLLIEDPGYKTTVLAEKLGVTRKTISLNLHALKGKGIIERIGSDRNGYWRIIND